jgi:hypothetical protein
MKSVKTGLLEAKTKSGLGPTVLLQPPYIAITGTKGFN